MSSIQWVRRSTTDFGIGMTKAMRLGQEFLATTTLSTADSLLLPAAKMHLDFICESSRCYAQLVTFPKTALPEIIPGRLYR